jgi:hypothetical protein
VEGYINGTAAPFAKPGSCETRPDLTVSFRLERGDQFVIGFQLNIMRTCNAAQSNLEMIRSWKRELNEFFELD